MQLVVSLIWCLVVVLVLLLRRPPRAVHPGIAVGIDLVLWLAFIFTLLFSVVSVLSVAEFDGPDYYSNRYEGSYSLAPNDTWVWVQSTNDYYNYHKLAKKTDAAGVTGLTTISTVSASATRASADAAMTTPPPVLSAAAKRVLGLSSSTSDLFDINEPLTYDDTYDDTYTYGDPDYNDPYTYEDPDYNDPYTYDDPFDDYTTDSYGNYYLVTSTVSTTTTTSRLRPSATRDCSSEFTSCAEQDAYVNEVWHNKSRRYALELLAAIVQGIAIVTHFALFVWACVDTHRRNRARRTDAMALNLLQDMRQRGYVMVPAADAAAGMAGRNAVYPYAPAAMPVGGVTPAPWQPMSPRAAEKAPAAATTHERFA